MKGIVIERHGGPEVLVVRDIPATLPGPGEVRIRVTHVGLNHLDLWVRRGVEGHTFPLPLVPGSDVVGIRADNGEPVALAPALVDLTSDASLRGEHDRCRTYRIRGEGCDGGMCEEVCAAPWQLLPLGRLAPAAAAALPLSLLTAWHMLVTRAAVRPGQTVVVQGGAGGVGHLAIQVARTIGARVAATASSEEKRALCRRLGAEEVFSYEDAKDGVRAWTHKAGVDVVVEHSGASTWSSSLQMARWGGTIVTCGATGGHEVSLDLRAVFFKQLSILGSTMGSFGELRDAWALVQAGRIEPVIHAVLPMTRLAEAHALIEERRVAGKVVVEQDLV